MDREDFSEVQRIAKESLELLQGNLQRKDTKQTFKPTGEATKQLSVLMESDFASVPKCNPSDHVLNGCLLYTSRCV